MEDGILINDPSVKANHNGSKFLKVGRRHTGRQERRPQQPRCRVRHACADRIRNGTAERTLCVRQEGKTRQIQNIAADALIGLARAACTKLQWRFHAVCVENAHRQQGSQGKVIHHVHNRVDEVQPLAFYGSSQQRLGRRPIPGRIHARLVKDPSHRLHRGNFADGTGLVLL